MTPVVLHAALRLYLIADPDQCDGPLLPAVEAALDGGVTAVQLRAKSAGDREICALARALRVLTDRHAVPLIVNDRVDIALAIGSDGVHLGATDLAPAHARRITPPGFMIGYSPDNDSDRDGDEADYLGIGPVFGTTSKTDAGRALGLAAFAARVQDSTVPVVGIGGIDAANAGEVVACGAAGVAVLSAILRARNPTSAARAIRRSMADRSGR